MKRRAAFASLSLFCSLPLTVPAIAAEPASSPVPLVAQVAVPAAERAKIEQVVREYLLANPELLVEVMSKLEERESASRDDKAKQSISQYQAQLFADASAPVGGNPKGDVTIVEFFDYQCGYCKAVAADMQKAVEADGKVRIVYKEFPILSPESEVAAKAALAANAQGKYQAFHDAMLATKGKLSEAVIMDTAKKVGLDVAKLKTDMAKPEYAEAVKKNRELARALGVRGTPAFVIGDQIAAGQIDLADFQQRIAGARKKSS